MIRQRLSRVQDIRRIAFNLAVCWLGESEAAYDVRNLGVGVQLARLRPLSLLTLELRILNVHLLALYFSLSLEPNEDDSLPGSLTSVMLLE